MEVKSCGGIIFAKISDKKIDARRFNHVLSPSALFVLYVIENKGPLTRKDIVHETDLTDRTISNALKNLERLRLVKKTSSDNDLRLRIYDTT